MEVKNKQSGVVSLFAFMAVAVILFISATNLHWGKDNYTDVIEADAKGYYAYLPAIFIYHDLNFDFMDEVEKKANDLHHYYDYRVSSGSSKANKYFCGTAVAEAPFFLGAHLFTKISGGDADGYSRYYPLAITIAAIFYCLLGLWAFLKCLDFFQIQTGIKMVSVFTLVFGTNLYYYTIGEPGMSHVYSFAFVALFFLFLFKWFENGKRNLLWSLAFFLGMVVLIRPVNIIILGIVPLVAGNFQKLKASFSGIFSEFSGLIFAVFIFVLVVFIQPLFYYIATGEFFLYSYGGETFNFFEPHGLDFLLSYKKGLFLYSPVLAVSLAGLGYLWNKSRFRAVAFILFFSFVVYILSSWWSWWYGGSFSSRVFVEYLSVFFILNAILLQGLWKTKYFIPVVILLFFLISLCQFQTFQYRHYIIHWQDMNKEKYWDGFLKIPD